MRQRRPDLKYAVRATFGNIGLESLYVPRYVGDPVPGMESLKKKEIIESQL